MNALKALFRGRINRLEWLVGKACLFLAVMLSVFVSLYLYGAFSNSFSEEVTGSFVFTTFFLILGIVSVISISLDIRRVHDIDCEWQWQLVVFAMIFGLPYLYIAFKRGVTGENRYGAPSTGRGRFSMIFNSDEKKRLDAQRVGTASFVVLDIFRTGLVSARAAKNGFVAMTIFQKTQLLILFVIAVAVLGIFMLYLFQR